MVGDSGPGAAPFTGCPRLFIFVKSPLAPWAFLLPRNLAGCMNPFVCISPGGVGSSDPSASPWEKKNC